MKRKFLCISCCFFLSLSLMCCSQIKSSLDDDSANDDSKKEVLINDTLSIDDSTVDKKEPANDTKNTEDTKDIKDNNSDNSTENKSDTSSNTTSEVSNNQSTSTTNTNLENLSSSNNSDKDLQTCRLFFYNPVDGVRYYVDKDISVEGNALVSALTSSLQENINPEFVLLTDKIGVINATVDVNSSALTVEFNDSFENYMDIGPTSEYELIYTLVNTYAYNYNVNKVSLYFNGLQYIDAPSADENGWYSPYFESSIQYNKN